MIKERTGGERELSQAFMNDLQGDWGKPGVADDLIITDKKYPQLGIRLRRGGSRKWIFRYWSLAAKKQMRATLGSVGEFTLKEARAWAVQMLAKTGRDDDPRVEKMRKRAAAAITLGSLVGPYLDAKKPDLRPNSFREIERYLTRYWAPLHVRGLTLIGRSEVAQLVREFATTHGRVAADRAKVALSGLFGWAMTTGQVDMPANPLRDTFRTAKANARDRVLSDSELRSIWNSCLDGTQFGSICRLLILTGARRQEVGDIKRSEIDFDGALWTLPADRTKNHKPHLVPLSDPALAVLNEVPVLADSEFVFGQRVGSGFSGWSKAKSRLNDRIIQRGEPIEWRLHDLRRTMATGMQRLGCSLQTVEAALGHVSGSRSGIVGVYQRHDFLDEKRAALGLWADHVLKIVVSEPAGASSYERPPGQLVVAKST